MASRQRAYHKGKLVTIIDGRIGGRGKTKIRTGHGFTEEVPAKELSAVRDDDPRAGFKFQPSKEDE